MHKKDIEDFKQAHKQVYFCNNAVWVGAVAKIKDNAKWQVLELPRNLDKYSKDSVIGCSSDLAMTVVNEAINNGIDMRRVGVVRVSRSGEDTPDLAVAVLLNTKGEVELVSSPLHRQSVLRAIKGKPLDYISAKDLAEGNMPRLFDT